MKFYRIVFAFSIQNTSNTVMHVYPCHISCHMYTVATLYLFMLYSNTRVYDLGLNKKKINKLANVFIGGYCYPCYFRTL